MTTDERLDRIEARLSAIEQRLPVVCERNRRVHWPGEPLCVVERRIESPHAETATITYCDGAVKQEPIVPMLRKLPFERLVGMS